MHSCVYFPDRSGARWQDLVLTVYWLLDYHPSGQEQMLWDIAELLHQQVCMSKVDRGRLMCGCTLTYFPGL